MALSDEYEDIVERYNERRKLRNMVARYRQRREGRLAARREEREDERWITVGAKQANKETGEPGHRGKHVLIDDEGKVVSGAGGSLTGKVFKGAKSTSGEVKVDPKKTSGAVAGESKAGEGKAGPEKTTKFGEWAKTEKGENAVAAANKLMRAEAADDGLFKSVAYATVSKAMANLPSGTVVEIDGKPYFWYKGESTDGFVDIGKDGWNGLKSKGYMLAGKLKDIKYLGSFDPKEIAPPGASKEIEFKGNYAEKTLKAQWEKARKEMKSEPGRWAKRYDIVKELDKVPKGTEIELDDGRIYKKYQTGWKYKDAGETKFDHKAYMISEVIGAALNAGKVKSFSAKALEFKPTGEGDYEVSMDSGFLKKFGDKYKPFHELVKGQTGAEASAWKHFENKIKIDESKGRKVCYYPGTWTIRLGQGLKGGADYHPYEQPLHEGAHLIDDRMGQIYKKEAAPSSSPYSMYGAASSHLSELYKDGKLRKTMEGEWREAKDKLEGEFKAQAQKWIKEGNIDKIKWLYWYDAISKDDKDALIDYHSSEGKEPSGIPAVSIRPVKAGAMLEKTSGKEWSIHGDVLDMFNMASHGKFGSGHPSSYSKGNEHTSTEFFAEAFSAKMCNPESLELIQKYFPKSYGVFEEIMSWVNENYEKI